MTRRRAPAGAGSRLALRTNVVLSPTRDLMPMLATKEENTLTDETPDTESSVDMHELYHWPLRRMQGYMQSETARHIFHEMMLYPDRTWVIHNAELSREEIREQVMSYLGVIHDEVEVDTAAELRALFAEQGESMAQRYFREYPKQLNVAVEASTEW